MLRNAREERNKNIIEAIKNLFKIEIIDAPIVDISSTRIREGIAAGEDMSEWMM